MKSLLSPKDKQDSGFHRSRFSGISLMALVVAFVGVGYVIVHSFAATPPAPQSASAPTQTLVTTEKQLRNTKSYSDEVNKTHDINSKYRIVWVKDGTSLADAVAQAKASGVNVVSELPALNAYTVSSGTVSKTKGLSSTQVTDTQQADPAVIDVLQAPGGGGTSNGPPVWLSVPSINGSLIVGNTLSTNNATWNNDGAAITAYHYQWFRCTANNTGSCTATGFSSTYGLGTADGGRYIAVAVQACNSYGCGAYDESGTVGPVQSTSSCASNTPGCPAGGGSSGGSGTCGATKISASLVRVNARTSRTASGDCTGSVGGVVGVMDTGVTPNSDLNIVGKVSFVGADPSNSCKATDSSTDDAVDHGTPVAGIIGAKDDTTGSVGGAPGVGIYNVRVADAHGSTTAGSVICAINFLIGTSVRTVNFSLNGTLPASDSPNSNCSNTNDAVHLAFCRGVSAGITFIVAAGNSNSLEDSTWPASYPEVLTVTSINDYNGSPGGGAAPQCPNSGGSDDVTANYSNYPSSFDAGHTVAAPGSCVYTTLNSQGSYGYVTGTSDAAPIVTAAVADCKNWGICSGSPAAIISKIYNDSASYNSGHPGYGYAGRNIGPLINLGLY